MVTIDRELNAIGLRCPLPLLKAKQLLASMESGQVLCVKATDQGSVADFKAYCELSGHQLLSSTQEADVYIHILQKA
ncbi:sulfurtransferase TusA family protein [Endozoicomonas sp. SM1973]|uniref:Sulfurtransferase TusA family protein n=1 Tax=Spartinivicinus marinus TaxID=2994442 RepID=A0A853IFS1_9GAMM|nr:sulfurtransferase TusA family protein [Spartinivicinus marinus]MCX4028743.1 sulfurtransferase TusA family protein [Spartinivicinus marinus]NYZ67995.1 sulfurtransferase TusA family protein [Spartinivicinus marinus]